MSCTDTNTINTSYMSSVSDLSVPSRMREAGLSTDTAMEQFAHIVRSTVLACTAHSKPISFRAKLYFIIHSMILFAIVLLVYNDCAGQPRHWLILKLSVVVLVGLGELYWLVVGEHHFKFGLAERVQQCLLRTMKTNGYTYGMPPRVPIMEKHKFVRVYRDGKLQLCPATLLVAGDVIQLLEGEKEPCRVKPATTLSDGNCTKECIVLESPIVKLIESYINNSNSGSNVLDRQTPYYRLLMTLLLLVAPVLCHLKFLERQKLHQIMITLLLLRSNMFNVLLKAWSCTRLQLVAEALKKSKTPYDETLDTDEFDEEAPPPSKEIIITPSAILQRLMTSLPMMLQPEFKDITELLGNMSVICFTDREGPISMALSSADEIVHLEDTEKVYCRAIEEWSMDHHKFGRLAMNHPEYRQLKPLGLATTSCSHCSFSTTTTHINYANIYNHRRFAQPEEYRRYLTSVAMQACQCAIGRSMGVEGLRAERLELVDLDWLPGHGHGHGDPMIVFTYKDRQVEGVLRCFAVGPLAVVLERCSEYYVDGAIVDMTPAVRRALLESEEGSVGRDEECIAYAYQTIVVDDQLVDDQHNKTPTYCFLGSITCSPKPRDDMQEFIDDIMNAGIRFVYLGGEGERQCKTFGSRLGLDTDWNGCILLSSSDGTTNYSDPSDIKARLPVGVHQIREHLKHVDDIPLHVSVFAACRDDHQDATDMLRIYQDYGETVAVVVSALHPGRTAVASQADIVIAMEPAVVAVEASRPLWEIAADWHTLPASLRLSFDSSPYILTDLVKEARTLRRARRSADHYFKSATLLCLLSFDRFSFLVLAAVLAVTVNAVVLYDADVLKLMPEKRVETDLEQFVGWLAAMVVVGFVDRQSLIFILIALFAATLHPIKPLQQTIAEHYQKHRPFMLFSTGITLAMTMMHPLQALLAVPPLLCHEVGKYMYRERFLESQKRSKLEFSTRLGMHSPI